MEAKGLNPIPWKRILAVVEPLSVFLLYVYLLNVSWLRWMDALVDFPRDLYFAWRVSVGDMMYKQLANWYGPLAQLAQGAAFHIFGVGIDTMIWTNIGLTALVAVLLRDIFRTLGNQWSGWLVTVVFLSVFAFGHYAVMANFNFLAPYVAQTTYSFAGLVLVLWALTHHLQSNRTWWLGLAGLGLAVAYLDKPEALLAAVGSLGIYYTVRIIQIVRKQPPVWDWYGAVCWGRTAVMWLAGGFLSLWLPVFFYFLFRGGLRYAIRAADFVPYSVLSSRFRNAVMTAPMQLAVFGFDQPWVHFFLQMAAGTLLLVVCGVMVKASWIWTRAPKYGLGWWLGLVLAVGAGGLGVWLAEYRAALWSEIGAAVVFPVILAAVVVAGWSIRVAWMGRADWARPLGLAVVGVAAALMLGRMILNGRIYQFGFFMMPLAVLWLIHLVVVEASRPLAGARRANLLLPMVFSALVLAGVSALAQISLGNYARKNFEIGKGRDHFYTFAPGVLKNGAVLQVLEEAFQETTPNARSLVVFPEGIAVNYNLRVPTTLTELEFHPVALAYAGPEHVLAELSANPPETIILHNRNFAEFGKPYFGADEASGRNLIFWIDDHYWLDVSAGHTQKTVTLHEIDVLSPRTPGSSGMELLHDANEASLPATESGH